MKNWFSKISDYIRGWWRRRRRLQSFKGITFCEPMIDPSSVIEDNRLVIIGTPEHPKWLRFACPCRCGEVIALNLMESYNPRWGITVHKDKTLTVSPSVDARVCRSHFWIRKNRINWV